MSSRAFESNNEVMMCHLKKYAIIGQNLPLTCFGHVFGCQGTTGQVAVDLLHLFPGGHPCSLLVLPTPYNLMVKGCWNCCAKRLHTTILNSISLDIYYFSIINIKNINVRDTKIFHIPRIW